MKKILLIILALTMIISLFGCDYASNNNYNAEASAESNKESNTETNKVDSETVAKDNNTEIISVDSETSVDENSTEADSIDSEPVIDNNTNSSDPPPDIWEEGPGTFYTLDDFRTFVQTNSRNYDDYSKDYPPHYIPHYKVDESNIVYIDELFANEKDLLAELNEIWIFSYGHHEYFFKSGPSIKIFPITPENRPEIAKMLSEKTSPYVEFRDITLTEAQSAKVENSTNYYYYHILHNVENTYLCYTPKYLSGEFSYYDLNIYTSNFRIVIHTYPSSTGPHKTFESMMADPKNAPIAAFFDEGPARNEAVKKIVEILGVFSE